MPSLHRRSYQQELLDQPDIPFKDIARNMRELNFINTHLGGHKITIQGLKKLLGDRTIADKKNPLMIAELGCGGGDNLQVIADWCDKKNIPVKTIGIDINQDCIVFASTNTRIKEAEWIISDFRTLVPDPQPDIIFTSLFCHHFDDQGMEEVLNWMNKNSRIGYFINDLHRHPLAYYSIKFLTSIFSRSYLVKHDAPLSVLRSFKKEELEMYLAKCGIEHYELEWKWAFRWLLTVAFSKQKKHHQS